MDKENKEEFGEIMRAILKKKQEKGEDLEVVNSGQLTQDDREVLNAFRAVYDKHLTGELNPEECLFRPCEIAPGNINVSREVIFKKCVWLTQVHNLISEIAGAGQQNFSALSDSDKMSLQTTRWIFHTLSRVDFSSEVTRLLSQQNAGVLNYQTLVIESLVKQFKNLNLDEDELRICTIYLIYGCLSRFFDLQPYKRIVDNVVFKYEREKDAEKDALDKPRLDKIAEIQEKILFITDKHFMRDYLWNFFADSQTPHKLDKADCQLLYLLFFSPKTLI